MGTPLPRKIRHEAAETVGRVLFFRERGRVYGEVFRGWIVPVSAASGVGKYLGLSVEWAVGLGLLIPVLFEGLTLIVGWFDWRKGVAESYTHTSASVNPYVTRQIELLEELVRQNGARERADHRPPTL